jgi:tetratricopeptide (TPR) repeat protein
MAPVLSCALRAALGLAGLVVAGCRGEPSCLELDAERQPERTVAACTARFESSRDPRAAVAVVNALTARKDDGAIVAWAERVGELPGTGKVWRRAAQAYDRRDDRAAMLAAAARAMRLWERAGELGEAAYEAHVLKTAYFTRSELLPALQMARRERELALASDDAIMRWGSFNDLFSILDELGDYAGAKALLREMQQQTRADDLASLRVLRSCEGLMHFREGHLELARLAYRDALEIPAQVADEVVRADQYNLVEIEVMLGDVEAAARALASAVATIPPEAPAYMLSARAFFTALVARARGDLPGAEAQVRGALAGEPVPFWAWQLEEQLGKTLEAQGRVDEALAAYLRSIAGVEALRKEVVLDVLQVALRERKRAPYEAAFELHATRGQVAAAMQIAQAMWQRGFVESFDVGSEGNAATASAAGQGTADPSVARVRGLSDLAPRLSKPSGSETGSGSGSGSETGSGSASGSGSGSETGSGSASVVAAPEVLAFIEARGALWRFGRSGGRRVLEKLALPAAEARRLVGELRARPDELASAARLGEALVPASAVAIDARGRPLAVIADGALAGLPFAALRLRDRWLVQDRTLRYWPALEPLGEAPHPRAADLARPVGAAVPPGSAALAVLAPSSTLAAARGEVIELSLRIGASPLLGEQATIAALRGSGGARLLHLAAHGGLAPGGAFVRMADGDVTAADIVTWKLAPRVVVLASCASGARPTGSMWGALGGAFLAAGSEAVVATLWSVEDAATAKLVQAFYAAGGERDPQRGLAAAQRAAIAAGVSPRQWAAFVVLGES